MSAQSARRSITRGAKPVKKPLKILSVEDIKAAEDITEFTLPVPEWDGAVILRTITKKEFDRISEMSKSEDPDEGVDSEELQRLLVMTSMKQPKLDEEDYEEMLEKSAGAFLRIVNGVMEHSGLKGVAGQVAREKRFRS